MNNEMTCEDKIRYEDEIKKLTKMLKDCIETNKLLIENMLPIHYGEILVPDDKEVK